ncbi:histone H1.1-like [Amblyraja radiata]|uniref:histone H1.1-like n=1 Tax=Amblyraja radiata TaxID=386614 RepID=UPI0014020090|nr:histone H1.1-like [Amblyraja radiata]XP_032903229.1 histone H1.1-like [Amblyraja radiata]
MTDIVRAKRIQGKNKPPKMPKKASVSKLILQAVAATKERRGLSLVSVKKMLSGNGYDVAKNNSRINHAVRTLVNNGSLVNVSGMGASGSFKVNKEQKDEVQQVARKELVSGAAVSKQPRGKRATKRPAPAKKPKKKWAYRRTMKDGARGKMAKDGRKLNNAPGRKAARIGAKGKRQRAKPKKPTRPPKARKPLAETSDSVKENQAGSEQQEST